MKKLLFFLLLSLLFLFCACSDSGSQASGKEVDLVNFYETNIILYEEQTYRLVPTVSPADAVNKELKWVTSRPDICTVDDGLLTAVSEGVSTIIAKAENGKSASVKVEVKKLSDIKSIHFTELSVSLSVGDTHSLGITSNPASISSDLPLSWSTSDDSVATVDGFGNVTAVSEGACLIFADLADLARATCEISVGGNEADLSPLVELSVRDLPAVFERRDPSGNVTTSVEITSYEVKRELTEKGVLVTLLLSGEKIYDCEGADARNPLMIFLNIYNEEDVRLDEWALTTSGACMGEAVTFEFAFYAGLRPEKRQFYVILRETRSEVEEE